ncbi:unnamed protein product [Laminaria digitata]
MEGSLQQQKESFGFQDSDVDDLRRLISDTNVYLLIVTLLASTLHLLFEFLAFKSDVDFWRRNKSLRGLSVRTLFMEVVFQTIILFSLVEEDASLLVTVPAGVGVLIQAFVYTFGFVLMTPQLYINYKLQSVAHLPWRFLCYRSLNTIIDDLFAFVIRMPTMHRLVS